MRRASVAFSEGLKAVGDVFNASLFALINIGLVLLVVGFFTKGERKRYVLRRRGELEAQPAE